MDTEPKGGKGTLELNNSSVSNTGSSLDSALAPNLDGG